MNAFDQLALIYLLAAMLFILGFKGLASPRTARVGNLTAMVGMAVAIVATLFSPAIQRYGLILSGIAIGGGLGALAAKRVEMTAMPQLVALLHSFSGLAAVLIALGTLLNQSAGFMEFDAVRQAAGHGGGVVLLLELAGGNLLGALTFTGSVVAFGKLQGLLASAPLRFAGQHWLNLVLALLALWLMVLFVGSGSLPQFLLVSLLGLALGVLLVAPIGGADMPVVVSMLNSYSGWAAAVTGFTLGNELLIITGSLVGASGAILSYVMCKGMNRSIVNVVFGGFGANGNASGAASASGEAERGVRSAAAEDAAFMMENAESVIIVPGYGMAVAQAQHVLAEVVERLEQKGVEVRFAIHPVAGRMPGHMNVLLAEADIAYDKMLEMDEINPEFSTTDVVLVLGANDVTNPAAKTDQASPIYGMPILDVERARQVFFVKRGMSPGYAGVQNLLFYRDNCSLVFGDAKKVCEQMLQFLS